MEGPSPLDDGRIDERELESEPLAMAREVVEAAEAPVPVPDPEGLYNSSSAALLGQAIEAEW